MTTTIINCNLLHYFITSLHVDKNIRLIDSPGIVFADGNTTATALRNCVNVEEMIDVYTPIQGSDDYYNDYYYYNDDDYYDYDDGNDGNDDSDDSDGSDDD
jgi:ribosome biogenesis GTPase A